MITVYTTVPDAETADEMARTLVEERVAACVNAHEVSSTYRWEGEVVEEDEVALDVKTALPFEDVRDAVVELHPYDVPAVLRLDVEGDEAYADWVKEETDD